MIANIYLLDKVKAKLTSWKAKNLSLRGRATLAKAVIEAILVFPMMTPSIPRSVLQDIKKMERGFIWGDSDKGRKVHALF